MLEVIIYRFPSQGFSLLKSDFQIRTVVKKALLYWKYFLSVKEIQLHFSKCESRLFRYKGSGSLLVISGKI